MDEKEKWTERQLDLLKQAITIAEKNGWDNAEGYRPLDVMGYIFLTKKNVPSQYIFSTRELLFDHEFTKALWGTEEVDNNGRNLKAIRLWANQVAVKHNGKLHNVEPNQPVVSIYETPELNFSKPPEELVEGHIVQYKLEKMAGSISFETHRLEPLEIDADTQPAYIWHMQQMATFENPEDYLSILNIPKTDTKVITTASPDSNQAEGSQNVTNNPS